MNDIFKIYKLFIIIGGILIFVGILLWLSTKFFSANIKPLPGDILIKKENFTFYFPITTSLILSILISLIFFIFSRFLK